MKQGKYFYIPEQPEDIERLWEQAESLDPDDLPAWSTPEDAGGYRYVISASWANLAAHEQEAYFDELTQLQTAGLIVDQDPSGRSVHRLYIAAPFRWSIGIYVGESAFGLRAPKNADNPVLTRSDVSDVQAVFVADPFMVREHDTWYMFFEVMNWRANKGEVGLAISEDGMKWTYQQIVLTEPFHLSYPYVFEWMKSYYMTPESYQSGSIRLYKALSFPTHWTFVGTMLKGSYFVDPSIFRYGDKWWLFTGTNPEDRHDTLRLYYADELMGPWLEHSKSPIVEGKPYLARPAGRVLVVNDRVVRYAQNCSRSYGTEVRAFEVTELTTSSYREREIDQSPVLTPTGTGWNANGMHHIDAHFMDDGRWIACVDGNGADKR